MSTIQELQAQIHVLLEQLDELSGGSKSFEKENSKIEAYLSDFTTRQGVLLTIAGLLTLLPFFDDRAMMSHFLIWVIPFLLISIFSYICSAKRINFLPSERESVGLELLTHKQINQLLKENYFTVLKFHRITGFGLTMFFVSFVANYYLLFFVGSVGSVMIFSILLFAFVVAYLRDRYLTGFNYTKNEQNGIFPTGGGPTGIVFGGISRNEGKTILVDAVDCFVSDTGEIFDEMHELLETYPNNKIILTGANDPQFKQFGLDKMPYEVFTLKHNPEKTSPLYYVQMLEHFGLKPEDVVYFEHNPEAVKSSQSVGIPTHFYDTDKKDLSALKSFLGNNL